MAGCTVNVVPLLPTNQNVLRNRKRHVIARVVSDSAAVEISVLMQLSARDRPLDRRAGGAQVSIKIAFAQGLEARLVLHVLATTQRNHQEGQCESIQGASHLQFERRTRRLTRDDMATDDL